MKKYLLLTGIIIFFLSARLYHINDIPSSLYWDEASIGYNAYSIATIYTDEWNQFFPLHFRAFGEFKLPVYIYSVALVEKLFGPTQFSVRLPAVLFSLGVVLLTYFLSLKIFQDYKIALFSSFSVSVSPWFFIFSRTGFEATAGLMFYLLGLYLFLNHRRVIFIVFSVVSFIFSIYSYNSFRIIVPLTFIFLGFYLWRFFNGKIKHLFFAVSISICLFVVSLIPIVRLMIFDSGTFRFQTIGLSDFSTDKIGLVKHLVENYLTHFNPDFLFLSGDKNLRAQQENKGQLYWFEIPFLVWGLFYLLKMKNLACFLPVFIILISPIPAAITRESPHALRSITMVPFLSMVSSVAIIKIIRSKFKKNGEIIMMIVIGMVLIYFGWYFKDFITTYPKNSAAHWQYGYKKVFSDYKDEFSKYDHILISDFYGQPYIFGLFYLKYDPIKFYSEVKYNSYDKWGFSTVESFSNFVFKPVSLEDLPTGKLLIFASPKEKLENLKEKNIIKNPDDTVAFYQYEYQN